jgi:hypothetical protein
MIQLFSKVCLYENNNTIVYGQINENFLSIKTSHEYLIIPCNNRNNRPDFLLKIKGRINKLTIEFLYKNTSVKFDEVLYFPFENCELILTKNSAIISTLCKHYSHRLDEWIQYNLNLGFSGIVIFNNDENKSNPLNELSCIQTETTKDICKKYKGKVISIDFPYSPFNKTHWNNIQRISLHIGVNAFRTKCKNIALIDADEFIYGPTNIEDFLKNYSTITISSNILTNKNDNDILNNNILKLANYVGEDNYTKTILDTSIVEENEFIVTPHEHPSHTKLPKTTIIYYHCWMNERCHYTTSMPMIKLI